MGFSYGFNSAYHKLHNASFGKRLYQKYIHPQMYTRSLVLTNGASARVTSTVPSPYGSPEYKSRAELLSQRGSPNGAFSCTDQARINTLSSFNNPVPIKLNSDSTCHASWWVDTKRAKSIIEEQSRSAKKGLDGTFSAKAAQSYAKSVGGAMDLLEGELEGMMGFEREEEQPEGEGLPLGAKKAKKKRRAQ